ncbi:hypothetical protein FGB62_22g476 [Gracilaria domingensis]|nr:hypothetical protein FGB62_22g476 [Gracilaria domingensis]
MGQHADARPLMDAIRDSFTTSSILQDKEIKDYESRTKGKSGLPAEVLFQVSTVNENAPSSTELKKKYDDVLVSARKRLELLKSQRNALRGLLDEKESHHNHTVGRTPRQYQLEVKEVFSRYRSKIGIIRRLMSRDIGSVSLDAELMTYHNAEQKYVERVADYASDVAQRYAEINQESSTLIPQRLISVLRSYGKICAQQTNCEIQLARSTAFLTSLSINDGSHLEMTTLSMTTLLRDIRSRTATCIKRKLEDVSEDAFKDLSGEVHAYLLSENLQRQDAYIRTMQACIRAYMLQRLRIHCFQVLVDIVCRKRDMLFDSVSRAKSCCSSSNNLFGADARTDSMELKIVPSETDAMIPMNPGAAHIGSFIENLLIDEVESSFFSSLLEDASCVVQDMKDRIGARKHWLDFEPSSQFNRTTSDLEDMLTSTSSVVEALVRHYNALLDGVNSTISSPNKSWIKRITVKHSVS